MVTRKSLANKQIEKERDQVLEEIERHKVYIRELIETVSDKDNEILSLKNNEKELEKQILTLKKTTEKVKLQDRVSEQVFTRKCERV
jgi:hypothetical protein